MATEKNPFEQIPQEIKNVIQIPNKVEDTDATFEVEPDGGVVVDFTQTTIEMEAEEPTKEWYGNLDEGIIDVIKTKVKSVFNKVVDKAKSYIQAGVDKMLKFLGMIPDVSVKRFIKF